MGLILRIDIDKPFGNNTFLRKVISKIREDYYFPPIISFGFLDQVYQFATLLHSHKIPAIFYFRNCTTPYKTLLKKLISMNHSIGFHAENTKSIETFSEELKLFSQNIGIEINNLHSFTKHGSGYYKLGKNHYPLYEEEKYKDFSKKAGLAFYFGNGQLNDFNSVINRNKSSFYKDVFWIEEGYRDLQNMSIEQLVTNAKNIDIPVLIHPENYYNRKQTQEDFNKLLQLSSEQQIFWKTSL